MEIKKRIKKLEGQQQGAATQAQDQTHRQRAILAVAKAYAGQGCEDLAEVVLQHDQQTGDHMAERIKQVYGGQNGQGN